MLIRVLGRAAVITAVAGLLGTSCGGGDSAAPSQLPTVVEVTPTAPAVATADATPTPTVVPPTAAPPTATPAPTVDEQAELEATVLEAHDNYFKASRASGDPPNPDHPDLIRWATGALLENVRERRASQREAGAYVRGGFDSHPRLLELGPGRALIEDCFLDTAPVFNANGDIVEAVPDERIYFQTVVVLTDGGWKVSELLSTGDPCDF